MHVRSAHDQDHASQTGIRGVRIPGNWSVSGTLCLRLIEDPATTPVSPRAPALLTTVLPEPRATTRGSGRESAHRDELARPGREPAERADRPKPVAPAALTDAHLQLEGFPADTWQDRWLLNGSDELGSGWGPQRLSAGTRSRFTAGRGTLIVLQAIRPSYGWLDDRVSATRTAGAVFDVLGQH